MFLLEVTPKLFSTPDDFHIRGMQNLNSKGREALRAAIEDSKTAKTGEEAKPKHSSEVTLIHTALKILGIENMLAPAVEKARAVIDKVLKESEYLTAAQKSKLDRIDVQSFIPAEVANIISKHPDIKAFYEVLQKNERTSGEKFDDYKLAAITLLSSVIKNNGKVNIKEILMECALNPRLRAILTDPKKVRVLRGLIQEGVDKLMEQAHSLLNNPRQQQICKNLMNGLEKWYIVLEKGAGILEAHARLFESQDNGRILNTYG